MRNTLYDLFDSSNENQIEFECPSCGRSNKISNTKCDFCSYDLAFTKSMLFSHYAFYNNALKYEQNGDYFNALIEISKFLAYEPVDETANKLFIYYLNKCDKKDEVKRRLEEFEEKFPRNPWIMQVETKGIDNIESPADSLKELNFNIINNQLNALNLEIAKSKVQTTNELGSIAINYYSNILRPSRNNKEMYYQLNWFFENVIVDQLSKREIRLEIFDGKNYNDLSNDDIAALDVKSTIEHKKMKDGTIITDVPGVYIRSALIHKQQVFVVKNETKKVEKETRKNNKKKKGR